MPVPQPVVGTAQRAGEASLTIFQRLVLGRTVGIDGQRHVEEHCLQQAGIQRGIRAVAEHAFKHVVEVKPIAAEIPLQLQADLLYERKYPVLVNHAAQTERARAVAAQLLGADNVVTRGPVMGSEDFAYMLEHRPGAYVRLGNGLGQDGGCMVHNPLYDFNDKALPIGAAFWASLAQSYLQ